jgi:hypothetical protein
MSETTITIEALPGASQAVITIDRGDGKPVQQVRLATKEWQALRGLLDALGPERPGTARVTLS